MIDYWNEVIEVRFRAWELAKYGWNMPWLACGCRPPGEPLLLTSGLHRGHRASLWRYVGPKQLEGQLMLEMED